LQAGLRCSVTGQFVNGIVIGWFVGYVLVIHPLQIKVVDFEVDPS
jgi:hypothetical protein